MNSQHTVIGSASQATGTLPTPQQVVDQEQNRPQVRPEQNPEKNDPTNPERQNPNQNDPTRENPSWNQPIGDDDDQQPLKESDGEDFERANDPNEESHDEFIDDDNNSKPKNPM